MTLWIISGYWCHGFTNGHKEMIQEIKKRMSPDDKICVIINNEVQFKQKYTTYCPKGWFIYKQIEPYLIENFDNNFIVEISKDINRTVVETLKWIKEFYLFNKYIFVNSGDQDSNCAEEQSGECKGIEFLYLGQPKISSSGEEKN